MNNPAFKAKVKFWGAGYTAALRHMRKRMTEAEYQQWERDEYDAWTDEQMEQASTPPPSDELPF